MKVGDYIFNLTNDDVKFIKENYINMTYREIGDVVGLSDKQVEGWVRNHIKNRVKKIRQFNSDYFERIDTPAKAYWLGLIYADGYIVYNEIARNYEFSIELKREDEYILNLLNNCLGGVHIVKRLTGGNAYICQNKSFTGEKESSVLRIYSKKMVLDLMNNGIDLNKTTTNTFPHVCDDLFPDFLRGYIDGDGCIHNMGRNHIGVHITSCNYDGLLVVKQRLLDLYGIDSRIYVEKSDIYRDKNRIYIFRSDDVRKLLDVIYYDAESQYRLERKYKIYKEYYSLAA